MFDGGHCRPMLVRVERPIPPRSIGTVILQDRDWRNQTGQDGKPVEWAIINDSDETLPAGTRGYAIIVQGDWRFVRV